MNPCCHIKGQTEIRKIKRDFVRFKNTKIKPEKSEGIIKWVLTPTRDTNLKIQPQILYENLESKGTELQIMREKGKLR